jgi:hypothetical protein
MNIVDQLVSGGTVDSRGSFTVDAEKARSKLERFRLADPLTYVVELVQAAVLAGATRVDIRVDADDFVLRCDGRPFSRASLDDLESAVLVRGDADVARQQLALGLSAAQALSPRWIRVRSGTTLLTLQDGRATLVDVAASGADAAADAGTAADDDATTTIELRESFRAGHFVEFFAGLAGGLREQRLLAERCRWARVPVVVNGKQVSGHDWPVDVHAAVHAAVDDDDVRGSVGFVRGSPQPPVLHLLRAGVLQESVALDDEPGLEHPLPRGLVGVVDVGALPRDASFTKFIRDDGFARMLALTVDAAVAAAAGLVDEVETTRGAWAAGVLREVLACAPHLDDVVLQPVRAARVFTDARRGAWSFDALQVSHGSRRRVVVARERHPELALLPADEPIVLDDHPAVSRALARASVTTADAGVLRAAAVKRASEEEAFRQRRAAPALPGNLLVRGSFEADDVLGLVGIRDELGGGMRVQVIVDGCLLVTRHAPFPFGVEVVLAGPLRPTELFHDVEPDELLARTMRRVMALVPALLDAPSPGPAFDHHPAVRSALSALLPLTIDGEALWEPVRVDWQLPDVEHPELRPLPLTGPRAHALVSLPLLRRMGSTALMSLVEVRDGVGPLGVVDLDAVPFTPSVQPTLVLDRGELTVVSRLAGGRIVSLAAEAHAAGLRAALLRRPPRTLSLDAPVTLPVDEPVDGRRVRGLVGWQPDGAAHLSLQVFCSGRPLGVVQAPAPIAGLVAALDDDAQPLLAADRPGPTALLERVALRALPRLIRSTIDDAARWRLVGMTLAALFPTPEHRAAALRLQQNLPAGEVVPAWLDVLSIPVDDATAGTALGVLLEEGSVPLAPAVRAALKLGADERPLPLRTVLAGDDEDEDEDEHKDGGVRSAGGMAGALRRLLPLDQLRCFQLDGRPVTLESLLARATVRWTTAGGSAPEGFDDVVLVTSREQEVLSRLCGPGFTCVNEAVAAARAREAFARRSAVEARVEGPVLVRRPLERGKSRSGEIALSLAAAAHQPQARLVLLRDGRPVVVRDVGVALGVGVEAVIEDRALTLTPLLDDVVEDEAWAVLLTDLRRLVDALFETLVEESRRQPPTAAARARLLEFVIDATARRRRFPARNERGAAAEAAGLELWRDVGGTGWSLRALRAAKRVRLLRHAPDPALSPPPGFREVIVVDDPGERALLARLTKIEDAQDAWDAAARRHRRQQSLPRFGALVHPPPLVQHRARAGVVDLWLFLPATSFDPTAPAELAVGDAGVVVGTVVPALYAQGTLQGEAVVREDLSSVRYTDGMASTVEREIAALWAKAARALQSADADVRVDDDEHAALDLPDDADAAEQRRRLLRSALRGLALALLPATATRSTATSTGNEAARATLRAALRQLPLIPVAAGGHLSIDAVFERRIPDGLQLLHARGILPPEAADATTTPAATRPKRRQRPAAMEDAPPSSEPAASRPAIVEPTTTTPPDPAAQLAARIVLLIQAVRTRAGARLTADLELQRLVVSQGDGAVAVRAADGRIRVDLAHPLARAALDDDAALVLLTSACVTRINAALASVSDADEATFDDCLARHALTLESPTTTS